MRDSAPVFVTGASGYLGTHLVAQLLRGKRRVRAAVRPSAHQVAIREALRRAGADDAKLEFFPTDLTADGHWVEAMDGCEEAYHLASPMTDAANPDDLVIPARDGTRRVLEAAKKTGTIRRVVMTSSFAAVGYTWKYDADYSEEDWTDPDTPGLAAYPLSKTLAERAAWEFMATQARKRMELVVINPAFILGPTLGPQARSSLTLVKWMLEGRLGLAPRQRFGLADVRDVAALHIRAMATPAAAGRRYLAVADGPTISFLELAQVLREQLGPSGVRVPTAQVDGTDPPPLAIRNDRAKRELGFRPRPVQTTIVESAMSLQDLDLLTL